MLTIPVVDFQLAADADCALTGFAHMVGHTALQQTVPSSAHVNADVTLALDAGMSSVVPSEEAEHVMLRLDDELAGLIEAADTPADQAGAHSTKPEPLSPLPGEVLATHSMSANAQSAKISGVLCMWAVHFCSMVKLYLCWYALHVMPLPCRGVTCSLPLSFASHADSSHLPTADR